VTPVVLLIASNVFMTIAWYGHLRFHDVPLWQVILVSWGIAFFEYCLQVPANRMGHLQGYSGFQLKIMQEVITLGVFVGFALIWLKERPTLNHLFAGLCLMAAVFFAFRDTASRTHGGTEPTAQHE
jgi:hypothetical protein